MLTDQLVRDAFLLAYEQHRNQWYDKERSVPYLLHLFDTHNVLVEFGHTDAALLAGGVLHDIIEDTPLHYHAIKERFGERVAEIVYVCSDGKGRNRKDRKAVTLPELITWTKQNGSDALTVKLADSIANARAAHLWDPGMIQMQQKDWPDFAPPLCDLFPALRPMWCELSGLLDRPLPIMEAVLVAGAGFEPATSEL